MLRAVFTAPVVVGATGMTLALGGLSAQEVGQSKEVSPGRVRTNLGEGPSNVQGFEKVRIVEDKVQPGASWRTDSMPVPMFCTLTKGELTVTSEGQTQTHKAGDGWVCKVGQNTEAKNSGSERAVMRMHHLIPADQK